MKHDAEFIELIDQVGELAAEQMLVEIFDAAKRPSKLQYKHIFILGFKEYEVTLYDEKFKSCIMGDYKLGSQSFMFALYFKELGEFKIENCLVYVWIDLNKSIDKPEE